MIAKNKLLYDAAGVPVAPAEGSKRITRDYPWFTS